MKPQQSSVTLVYYPITIRVPVDEILPNDIAVEVLTVEADFFNVSIPPTPPPLRAALFLEDRNRAGLRDFHTPPPKKKILKGLPEKEMIELPSERTFWRDHQFAIGACES